MKKTLLTLAVVFILVSCGYNNSPYPVLIQNDSTKVVSYRYQNYIETLAQAEKRIYVVEKETDGPVFSLVPAEQPRSVIAVRKTEGWYFMDNKDSMPLTVTNELPFAVTLTAADFYDYKNNDYIENRQDDPYSTKLKIDGEDTISQDIFIYTRRPRFSASEGNIRVNWKIEKDSNGKDTMDVTIRLQQ